MAERNKVLKEIIGELRGLKNRRQSQKIQKDLAELQKKVRAISTAIRKVKREKKVNDNRQVDDWDPRYFYAIQLKREQKSRKFKMKGQRYGVKFHRLSEKIPPAELPRALPRVIGSLVDDLKKKCGAEDHDYLRLIIHHPSLKSEVWIPYTLSKELGGNTILDQVEKVQQSNENFKLEDGQTTIEIIHMKVPYGSGGNSAKHLQADKTAFRKGKKSIVCIENDSDHMCLARALVVTRLYSQKPKEASDEWKHKWDRMRKPKKVRDQTDEAKALCIEAGVSSDHGCGPVEWEKFQKVLGPAYRIKIFQQNAQSRKLKFDLLYKGNVSNHLRPVNLYVLFNDNHYDAITSMSGVIEKSYYCDFCDVGYSHREDHRTVCPVRCNYCLSSPPCPWDNTNVECQKCGGHFPSMECYWNHLKPMRGGRSICDMMIKCTDCGAWMSKNLKRIHRCGDKEHYCNICKKHVEADHLCYVQKQPPHKKKKKDLYVFYDFECSQETGVHVPNFCVAHRACADCIHLPIEDECQTCSNMPGGREVIFSGKKTLEEFLTWLFSTCQINDRKEKKQCHEGATAIAHNMKDYDGQFILHFLVKKACIKPDVLMNGAKIMTMKACGIRFIDSYNFMPSGLSKLPKAFGLTEMKKGHFPHLFNTTENQKYVGPYPPLETYLPDGMKPDDREELVKWYDRKVASAETFDFAQDMLEYCRSDVDILRRCCGQFQQTIKDLVKVDPFAEAITFASAANLAFRRNFMPEQSLAIIPTEGYQPERKYSVKALRWLKWIAHETNHDIRHARNGGEVRIGRYSVDGYNMNNQTLYEFYGCFWHGCPECFPNLKQEEHPVRHGCTFDDLYQATLSRQTYLNALCFNVETIWEHDFDRRCKEDEAFGDFIRGTYDDIADPLQPRDALFGGRTNATRLYCDEGDMRYIDICSLYPYVLK